MNVLIDDESYVMAIHVVSDTLMQFVYCWRRLPEHC